ncbi:MAG: signal peptide peptidase SppA [Planctomycetia bacterium]|nr:signal peptide peptidase SppA [Planctomycetia bacterium]
MSESHLPSQSPRYYSREEGYSHIPIPPPLPIYQNRTGCFRSSCLGCGTMLVLFFLFCCGLAVLPSLEVPLTRKHVAGVPNAASKIAILQIEDTILSNKGFINDQIEDVLKDPTVGAVVLRIDSPGGTVSASDYYYHKLRRLREERDIPIVVSMGGVCASGGYYIAMSVGNSTPNVLFAEPTTWTGSIGVILSHYDLSELAENIGIEENSIKSHELKGMGSLLKPMTEREREIFQTLVNDSFARFKEVVCSGRATFAEDKAKLDAIATGQVFSTREALTNGLVDSEGYLEDAVKRAMELMGADEFSVEVYRYESRETFLKLLSGVHAQESANPIETLRKWTVPQAYYL